jgi:hypothetical protein
MNKNSLFFLSVLTGIIVYSCKKSDNSTENSSIVQNGFKIGTVFYSTEKAGLNIFHDTFQLIIYSSSVTFNINEQHWKGIGNAIAFNELISTNIINGVPVGTFHYNENDQNGFFTEALTFTNYNFTKETGSGGDCINGWMTISQSGSQFYLKYDLKNSDSSLVIGEYYGIPQNISSWFHNKK